MAWDDIVALYRPLIVGWLRGRGLRSHEVDDLSQSVLLAVFEHLPKFEHFGRPGAFRTWLRTIVKNACAMFWRDLWQARRVELPGSPETASEVERFEDAAADLDRLWDEEHDQYVLRCLLDLVALEFGPTTIQAFRRLALDGASGAQVAGELGMTIDGVYAAKSRVLRRLREEAAGFLV